MYLPGGGSTGVWTPDEVADIDPLNQNFQKIDTFAGEADSRLDALELGSPAGVISLFAGTTAPEGYLICDGALKSRTAFARLYGVIGTIYGGGDGSTTFTLPDLRSRVPVGLDSRDGQFDILSKSGGAKTHTLSAAEMPSHNHTLGIKSMSGGEGGGTNRVAGVDRGSSPGDIIDAAGGNAAHNNLQPFIVLHYIIKT
jgi:microcystin-dependent protein